MNLDEYCAQNKFVYTSTEEIRRTLSSKNILQFHCGETNLAVKIPHELQKEILTICSAPTPFFDYLVLSIDAELEFDVRELAWKADAHSFSWIVTGTTEKMPRTKIPILTVPQLS